MQIHPLRTYKKYILYGMVIFSSLFYKEKGYAQSPFKIEKLSVIDDAEFPLIHCANKYTENKINTLLQLCKLELLIDKKEKHIFEQVTREFMYGLIALKYTILNNSDRNLSIKFDGVSSGASVHTFVNYYNFNPENGDRYDLRDFFDTDNFIKFKELFNQKQIHLVLKQVDSLKKKKNTDTYEIYLLEYILTEKLKKEVSFDDFYFTEDKIFFDFENLIEKPLKRLELKTISYITIDEIKHLLNDIGKVVFITGKNLKNHRSKHGTQLYEGFIAEKYPFYFTTFPHYSAIYAYKKYGKGILLSFKEDLSNENTRVYKEYKEEEGKYDLEATLTFEDKGDTLIGFWIPNKGKKKTFWAKRK
ncbi:Hypothetical protein Ccan_08960 [Capnocytophaga canimorsus Cc5]|uniref:Uncharacterized protein n=1 Tax=Capnocytophaga canimorsus (strain 5) TaxID=860228 RepID=F9YUF9_CAPCC|nr:hypothetical protein [Capnocytophaga canimorsus]AEK23014.1 Hypothetical protein Ccan_08960 [Capnocytophaga canimorsus Cc5]